MFKEKRKSFSLSKNILGRIWLKPLEKNEYYDKIYIVMLRKRGKL